MVSFFGLKLGGDRKKSQSKQSDKKAAPQPQWVPATQDVSDRGQPFGSHNFSRPQMPSSRPGTSHSTTGRISNWRDTFLGGNSSMVDLAAPKRRPSISSLRHHASDADLKKPWSNGAANGSSTSLAMPSLLGADGVRPGTPSRPGQPGTRKADWVNPLDVHFGKDTTTSSGPKTPVGGYGGAKSPLGRFEFGAEARLNPHHPGGNSISDEDPNSTGMHASPNGYPSPPQSIESGDQLQEFSPISPVNTINLDNRPSSSRRNAPITTLRTVDRFSPAALPSPAPSASRTSEERWELPVIRNVQAKRDTLTYHAPRRQSFTMELEEEREMHRRQQSRKVEGFSGNFADFDFGESVPKVPVKAATMPLFGESAPKVPVKTNTAMPMSGEIIPNLAVKTTTAAATTTVFGERGSSLELVESPIDVDEMDPFQIDDSRYSPKSGMVQSQTTAVSVMPFQHEKSPPRFVAAVQGRAPLTFSDQPAVPAPSGSPRRTNRGPPPAAVGAHSGSSVEPFERAPPRGFNSQLASKSRSGALPQPLRPGALSSLVGQAEADQHSPRSPFGPPVADNNYMRFNEAPRPPPDRPLPSPFATRTPMEGSFPIKKGLPRGRQPSRPSPESNDSYQSQNEAAPNSPLPFLGGGLGFDQSEPRRSAIPAPLTPMRRPSSPDWHVPTPTSAVAPRIPSPTFSSLEHTISSTSEELAKSFDISFDIPLTSPILGQFFQLDMTSNANNQVGNSPTRVEAARAPPRPTTATDQGPLTTDFALRSPLSAKAPQIQAGFI